jgi:hypothetical protein
MQAFNQIFESAVGFGENYLSISCGICLQMALFSVEAGVEGAVGLRGRLHHHLGYIQVNRAHRTLTMYK